MIPLQSDFLRHNYAGRESATKPLRNIAHLLWWLLHTAGRIPKYNISPRIASSPPLSSAGTGPGGRLPGCGHSCGNLTDGPGNCFGMFPRGSTRPSSLEATLVKGSALPFWLGIRARCSLTSGARAFEPYREGAAAVVSVCEMRLKHPFWLLNTGLVIGLPRSLVGCPGTSCPAAWVVCVYKSCSATGHCTALLPLLRSHISTSTSVIRPCFPDIMGIIPEVTHSAPPSLRTDRVRLAVLMAPKPGLSFEEFDRYWLDVHAKVFSSIAIAQRNLLKYEQFHLDPAYDKMIAAQTLARSQTRFRGIAIFEATSLDKIFEIFQDEEYLRVVVPDEHKFFDHENAQILAGPFATIIDQL